MFETAHTEAKMHVSQRGAALVLRSEFPEGRGNDFVVVLKPGEAFGGHIFEEWETVAKASGVVSADWLYD